jgi:hypothetical protein
VKCILVFNITRDGKVGWVKPIPKKQLTFGDGALFSSVISEMSKGNLYLIYNAHKDDVTKTMSNPGTSVSYITKISSTGEEKTERLFNSKEEATVMTPRINYKPGGDRIIIHNVKGKNFKLAEIGFN